MKRTSKAGTVPRHAIVRYTRDIVADRRRRTADDPVVWFTFSRKLRQGPVGTKPGAAGAHCRKDVPESRIEAGAGGL